MLPPRITRSGLEVMAFHPDFDFVLAHLFSRIMSCLTMLSTAGRDAQGCKSLASRASELGC